MERQKDSGLFWRKAIFTQLLLTNSSLLDSITYSALSSLSHNNTITQLDIFTAVESQFAERLGPRESLNSLINLGFLSTKFIQKHMPELLEISDK